MNEPQIDGEREYAWAGAGYAPHLYPGDTPSDSRFSLNATFWSEVAGHPSGQARPLCYMLLQLHVLFFDSVYPGDN